jgi:branched-subunit amino acid transport protein AzlD
MLSTQQAIILTIVMGAVILFCRAFPFIFFRDKARQKADATVAEGGLRQAFLAFIERVTPPVAMCALMVNAVAGPIRDNTGLSIPMLASALLTGLLHLWKRNTLLSIVSGTVLYMVLIRIL